MTDNRIKQIADHYGLDIQLIQCASELNELGAEATRLALARKTGDPMKAFVTQGNIVGEIADVEIMCEQVKYLLKATAAVDVVKEEKIRRQMVRMEKSSPLVELVPSYHPFTCGNCGKELQEKKPLCDDCESEDKRGIKCPGCGNTEFDAKPLEGGMWR